jgi:hypothetical protein
MTGFKEIKYMKSVIITQIIFKEFQSVKILQDFKNIELNMNYIENAIIPVTV